MGQAFGIQQSAVSIQRSANLGLSLLPVELSADC